MYARRIGWSVNRRASMRVCALESQRLDLATFTIERAGLEQRAQHTWIAKRFPRQCASERRSIAEERVSMVKF
jgi:hypothetical protein